MKMVDRKECSVCHETLPLTAFSKSATSKYGVRPECKACRSIWRHELYVRQRQEQNPDYVPYQKKNKERTRWYDEYKLTLACEMCGEDHESCIEFHHRNPQEKVNDIKIMLLQAKYSKYDIFIEMAKCAVLCANCHRKTHFAFGYDRRSKTNENAASALPV